MLNRKKHTALTARQVSLFDHPELIGAARYGVTMTPSEIAERFQADPERSYDDLGVYEFLGIQTVEGEILGFRKHIDAQAEYSYVTVRAEAGASPKNVIARVCDLDVRDIVEFDEEW